MPIRPRSRKPSGADPGATDSNGQIAFALCRISREQRFEESLQVGHEIIKSVISTNEFGNRGILACLAVQRLFVVWVTKETNIKYKVRVLEEARI